jgi:hypothetical protein
LNKNTSKHIIVAFYTKTKYLFYFFVRLVYDFENSAVPIEISPQSSVALSNIKVKNGAEALEWQWTGNGQLTWDLSSENIRVKGMEE